MFAPSFFLMQGFLPHREDPEAQNSYSSKVMMLERADAGNGNNFANVKIEAQKN